MLLRMVHPCIYYQMWPAKSRDLRTLHNSRHHGKLPRPWRHTYLLVVHICILPTHLKSWDTSRSHRPFSKTSSGGDHYNDVIMSAMASQITSLTIVYPTLYSGADQWKHLSSASLAFMRGTRRWPVNSPHKGPVTRKMFLFDDVIMQPEILWKIYLTSQSALLPLVAVWVALWKFKYIAKYTWHCLVEMQLEAESCDGRDRGKGRGGR